MPKANLLRHLTIAAVSLVIALSLCSLVAGGYLRVLKEPIMLTWLLLSWVAFYLVGFCIGGWGEPEGSAGADEAADSSHCLPPEQPSQSGNARIEEDSMSNVPDLQGKLVIGQAFYHDGQEDSALKPGHLVFENGILRFHGAMEVSVDLAKRMQKTGEGFVCVIDDEMYDNPSYGRREPVRMVRILHNQNLYEPVAAFLMPMGSAKLLEAVIREYISRRTAELEQSGDLLQRSVQELVQAWSADEQAEIIIQAFLSKAGSEVFLNPACLMSFEARLRNKLLDGHLGHTLLWTSALETQWLDKGTTVSLDLLPAEARSFYYDSFRFLVRLLQRECPSPKSYPELVYALTTWLLLREAAVKFFANALETVLGEVGYSSIKQSVSAYVGYFPEPDATHEQNLSRLAYLLVSRGLLAAPMVYGDAGYNEHQNILLLLDVVKVHVADALEEKRLDRFADRLFAEL